MKRSRFIALLVMVCLWPAAIAWSQPSIEFETTSFDFGTNYPNQDLVHTFEFTNKGNQPLEINRVNTSCGCTAAVASSTTIPASATGALSVTMTTISTGQMEKSVMVETNDPDKRRLVLKLTSQVRDLWSFSPQNNFTFRDIPLNTTESKTFTLETVDGENFDILGHKVSRPEFEVEFGEVNEGAVPVTVTLHSGQRKQTISDTLEIRTNHPKQAIVQARLYAQVVGNIRFDHDRLYFGSIPAGKTVERELTAELLADANEPFKIENITSEGGMVTGEVVEQVSDTEVKLQFTFQAPNQGGYHNGEIQLHTNVQSEPVSLLPYSALVRKSSE